jgi:hypothetical protein
MTDEERARLLEEAFDKGVITGLALAVQALESSSSMSMARRVIETVIANPPPSSL